jgi:hypothetical protein
MAPGRHVMRRDVTCHCLRLWGQVVAWTWRLAGDHAGHSSTAKRERLKFTFSISIKVQTMPYWKRGTTCFRGLAILDLLVVPEKAQSSNCLPTTPTCLCVSRNSGKNRLKKFIHRLSMPILVDTPVAHQAGEIGELHLDDQQVCTITITPEATSYIDEGAIGASKAIVENHVGSGPEQQRKAVETMPAFNHPHCGRGNRAV